MSASAFDPDLLMAAVTEQALTRRPPIPAGTELLGMVGKPTGRQNPGKQDPSKLYTFFDFPIEVDLTGVPGLAEMQGTTKINLRHSVSLDLTASGTIDWSTGKNGGLRRMREALDMNTAGQPFSIAAMQGRPIRVKIGNRTYEGEIYDEIESVSKV